MIAGVKSKKKLSELLQNGDDSKNEKRTLYRSLWTTQTELPVLQEAIAEYDIIRQVGKGTFSTVYYALHKKAMTPSNGHEDDDDGDERKEGDKNQYKNYKKSAGMGVAIKLIDKNRVTQSSDVRKVIRNVRRINTEIDIMKTASHDGICRVLHAFQTDQHVFIVLEYAERDLFGFMSTYPNGLPVQIAQYLNRIIALSVRHLHTRRIAHRDIKPENILVKGELSENNLIVKLCDFGLSLRPETKCADFVGSPGFFAPEILLDAVYDAFATDIWSFGALLLETVCGTPTFENIWLRAYRFLDRHDMFRDLIKDCVEKLPSINALARDKDLFKLVTGVLHLSPERRDTIATVVMNPWLYLVTESPDDPGKLEILRLTIADDLPAGGHMKSPGSSDAQAPCRRRDALMSIAVDAKGSSSNTNSLSSRAARGVGGSATTDSASARPSRPTSQNGSNSNSARSRARSMTINMFRKSPKKNNLLAQHGQVVDEYTLPPMTICHLDDSGVVRQVVQAKLSMAFPNHRLVNFADSTHLIHTIMASQEKNPEKKGDNETIRICIFDENIGEDLKGSDLANMLKKLGYKGIVLCMTANEDLKAGDVHSTFDGVLSKQITTVKLKTQLIDAWKRRFGQASLMPVVKANIGSDDEDFLHLRSKVLDQMLRNPKSKLKRVELLEMKGDLESVRCSQGLLEQVRGIINSTSADDYVSFTEEGPLFQAIKKELQSLDLSRIHYPNRS